MIDLRVAPADLVDMLRQRRVIPFIGAGFSAGLGLPDWDAMLEKVASEIPDLPDYAIIKECCNSDYLQIAEYLFIKSDRSIGPLRHKISTLLQTKEDFLASTPHVELVNLNVQQIYTTNYDEALELTFRALGQPYSFVALPKHIATSDKSRTQIVKYHGDLRFDASLVLTESSYYTRLEFESPMDLKFRSDLLGQSVLFMGYSFRDINIRIIWFKLMEMMRDVPEADRPTSYIVRFERNQVLEDLYRAVGIKTIYLDPDGLAKTTQDRTRLLGNFLLTLSIRVGPESRMPQSNSPMFLSRGLFEEIAEETVKKDGRTRRTAASTVALRTLLDHASLRTVPPSLLPQVDEFLSTAVRGNLGTEARAGIAKWAATIVVAHPKGCPGAKYSLIRALMREESRKALQDRETPIPWDKVWSTRLTSEQAEWIVKILANEVETHKGNDFIDDDLAYCIDIAKRMLNGTLVVDRIAALRDAISALVAEAAEVYPAVAKVEPNVTGLTDLSELLSEIAAATNNDDIPF